MRVKWISGRTCLRFAELMFDMLLLLFYDFVIWVLLTEDLI